jgi:hypothetical protein
MPCNHRRRKKNYPFGHHSKPKVICKDCGELVTNHELMLIKRREKYAR